MAENATNPFMAALEKFDATEANLIKLERLWSELETLTPGGINFGSNPEYEDRIRSYCLILEALPKIDGWKPTEEPKELNDIAQNRLDAADIGEPEAQMTVENWIEEPGKQLREYRFRFAKKRRDFARDALDSTIVSIDHDLKKMRSAISAMEDPHKLDDEFWADLRSHIKELEVLTGTMEKPSRWGDLHRHMHFGYAHDFDDIEAMDWPDVKRGLRKNIYGALDPIPVEIADLSELIAARPKGKIATELSWSKLQDQDFERLIFSLISNAPGYENPEWLMHTKAADRGRDLSVIRVIKDSLSNTQNLRVIIQCKHWLSKSIGVSEVSTVTAQMALWNDPRVDVLVVATSGRFTADAVAWIEQRNASGTTPRIEMWPESHLERVLAERPDLIAEFSLR